MYVQRSIEDFSLCKLNSKEKFRRRMCTVRGNIKEKNCIKTMLSYMEVVCSSSFQGERNAKHIPLDSKMNRYRLKEKISQQAYKFRPGICQFCIKRLYPLSNVLRYKSRGIRSLNIFSMT